jgi:3-oxoacyl-[acyl-carrier protein] reductase
MQTPVAQLDTPLTPLLAQKHAVIFGAGGDVGSAMAREFAARGATVFLLWSSARQHRASSCWYSEQRWPRRGRGGRRARRTRVNFYLDRMAKDAGSIDIVLNLTGPQPQSFANGTITLDLSLEYFMLPLTTLVPSQFITPRTAARHIVQQHSGVWRASPQSTIAIRRSYLLPRTSQPNLARNGSRARTLPR